MEPRSPQQIALALNDPDELFAPPHLDPFRGQFHEMSGMERLVAELEPRVLMRPVQTTVTIPADRMSDGLKERCDTAIKGYCASRHKQIDLERSRVVRQGRKELRLGLLFLAACLLASGWFEVMPWLPEFPRHFLSEGLVIVGWIALWHPVDLLLFERWSLLRKQRILQCIHDMELRIEPAAASATPAARILPDSGSVGHGVAGVGSTMGSD